MSTTFERTATELRDNYGEELEVFRTGLEMNHLYQKVQDTPDDTRPNGRPAKHNGHHRYKTLQTSKARLQLVEKYGNGLVTINVCPLSHGPQKVV